MGKIRTMKSILGWLLTMVLIVVTLSPVQAATYNEVPIRNQAGYDFSLLMSDTRNGWNGLQIGEYCYVKVGQRITPQYSGYAYTNMSYYTTSGSAISIYENLEQLPTATINNRPIYRTLLPKKPTDFHMAYEANMKWCIERVNPIDHEVYVGPGYGETEGHMIIEATPNFKVYPSINYYGVNYDLDAGNWKEKTDWIETKDGKDYGIWKSTQEQYDEDGNLYTDNIWFTYEGYEVVVPELEAVTKAGYELKGWGTTGSAIVVPGGTYSVSSSDAEYRTEWQQEKINIKALWEPKNIGVQQVKNITKEGATFTADYEAYYDLTDKGFMLKKSSDTEWINLRATDHDGKLIVAVNGLENNSYYDVKGYIENKTGRIENDVVSFKTHRLQSVGDVTVNNITSNGASFSAAYVSDDELLEKGFKYKKTSDTDWSTLNATINDDNITANVANLSDNTSYTVKAYIKTVAGDTEGNEITYKTLVRSTGNSGGGGYSGSANTIATSNTTIAVKTNTGSSSASVTSTITNEAKSYSDGKASAEVTESQVKEAVSKAVEEAVKQGDGTAIKVEIKVTAPAEAKTVEASLAKSAVKAVADSKIDELSVATAAANITFDKAAIATISKEATADVKVTASKVDTEALSESVKAVVGDRPVFNFSVTSGDTIITQFGGIATVSIAYTPKEGEDTNAIVIYYINVEGKLEIVKNCVYNKGKGVITFKTNHFSKFAVGYNKLNFKDVAQAAWYNNAVTFVAAREIATGTGNGNFSPESKLTRGQFMVMVMKAYGIESHSTLKDNFTDAGNTYYTGYLAQAKKLGITAGIGNNMFAPNNEITRQEMFTLLYNTLKKIGKLPAGATGKTLTAYSDADQISNWAKNAMTFFVETGALSGNGGKLDPAGDTNRAQMAQVLYNLMSK